ncbi:hypothetical protein [Streptomyces sp. NPDC090054]|uniref:hypothetical protein n=1 Tax=Streptomyces sp. NPDC090054 TaxID=3365933 RepID=UPI00380D87DF
MNRVRGGVADVRGGPGPSPLILDHVLDVAVSVTAGAAAPASAPTGERDPDASRCQSSMAW